MFARLVRRTKDDEETQTQVEFQLVDLDNMNYYEGFTRARERDLRMELDSAEPADDFLPPRWSSGFRSRMGTGLIGLGFYLLKEEPPAMRLGQVARSVRT